MPPIWLGRSDVSGLGIEPARASFIQGRIRRGLRSISGVQVSFKPIKVDRRCSKTPTLLFPQLSATHARRHPNTIPPSQINNVPTSHRTSHPLSLSNSISHAEILRDTMQHRSHSLLQQYLERRRSIEQIARWSVVSMVRPRPRDTDWSILRPHQFRWHW